MFVEPGTKVDGSYYREELLAKELLPAIRSIAGDVYVLQDNAPAHRARQTVELLRRETRQTSLEQTCGHRTDLNPVDYCVWSLMQERVYRTPIRDLSELRRRLVDTWCGFQQSTVDQAIDQWRKRLDTCVCAQGGHFELLL